MTKKSIYLKYREERDYAKYLKEFKKNPSHGKKVARVQLERVDLNALMKQKASVPVSLPIKYFHKTRSTISMNHDGQKELQIPKGKIGRTDHQDFGPIAPATSLRMVRHPSQSIVAAPHDTTAGTTMIKSVPMKPNLLPVNLSLPSTREAEKKTKKVETYTSTNSNNTAAKANEMPFEINDQISIKRRPTKDNHGIAHRKDSSSNSKEVGTNNPTDIIDTAAKANVMPFQGDNTAEKANVMPCGIAHRSISLTKSKEVGTNTDKIDTGAMSNNYISIKHKLPVPVAPTKENCGLAHKEVSFINSKHVETNISTDIISTAAKSNEKKPYIEVNSANEVKRCLKVLVITSTQTDEIHIVNENELQILGIVTKSGVTNDELVDALESFKKVKELSKYNVTEVIDLDELADDNGANLLELARFHSDKNKKALYNNSVRESNVASTKSPPPPIDLEQQKILEMRYKLINSMNYEQLKNMIDSQDKTNNKENSNKKRKTTESGDNYDEANMEMDQDVLETQTIMNRPVTAAPLPKPSLQKPTTQQRQMQPIKAQKQNKEPSLPQLNSTPIHPIIRQDTQLECLQHQKMQQQQYLQELRQNNMRAKPKQLQQEQYLQLQNLQTQQPHSKSPPVWGLYSKSPQFQQPRSNSPQFQQPHSKSPHFQPPHSNSPQFQPPHSKSPQFQQPHLKSPQFQQPHSKSPHFQPPHSNRPQFQLPHSISPQFQQPHSKSSQFQQPHSKSPQFQQPHSKSPQFQQPHSKSPHDQQPQSQPTEPTELQEQLQHPLDRRIQIRDEQRAALPQQHYPNIYESPSNGYQNPVFSRVPQTINSAQQPQFPIYPGDPRIQALHSQMSQAMPSTPQLFNTYEANLQNSNTPYPYQNNQQYW